MATIGGAAIGIFLVSNSGYVIKHTLKDIKKVFIGARFKKEDYLDLLCLMFQLLKLAKTKGVIALEAHIEKPAESTVFRNYPKVLADHVAVGLLCDYLRLVSMNQDDPHQIDDVMAREIKQFHQSEMHASHALQTMADGLPALGIVAAVLGVVKTMGSITEPPEILGRMIGGALCGTFLGVLLAYGLVGPLASRLKGIYEEEVKYYQTIRAIMVAHLFGHAPQISIETGRKAIEHCLMPEFEEVEERLSSVPPA
jgi:chemotaxis protein MotA